MAETTLGAIVHRFDTSDVATDVAAVGGLWFGEMPEEKSPLPWVILWQEGEKPDPTAEDDYLEDYSIRFEVYAAGLLEAERIAKKIKKRFDLWKPNLVKSAFQLDDGIVWHCTRTNYLVSPAGFKAGTPPKKVYQCDLLYILGVRKTLT